MTTMTATPISPLDHMLTEKIKSGPAPMLQTWHYYEPAKQSGVHKQDCAFVVIWHEVTEALRAALAVEIAYKLAKDIVLPERSELAEQTFLSWFHQNHSDLYERVMRVVDNGLRPWRELAERENENSVANARKAFLKLTNK